MGTETRRVADCVCAPWWRGPLLCLSPLILLRVFLRPIPEMPSGSAASTVKAAQGDTLRPSNEAEVAFIDGLDYHVVEKGAHPSSVIRKSNRNSIFYMFYKCSQQALLKKKVYFIYFAN